ncbi:MAG: hypothetical protein WD534_15045 [Phycisphaeraceae bacterium]
MSTFPPSRKSDASAPRTGDDLPAPSLVRNRVDRLVWSRQQLQGQAESTNKQLDDIRAYLGISDTVSDALRLLGDQLFRQLLDLLEGKLSIALQEILEQPIRLHAEADFKRNAATVEFWVEHDGNREDILRGQGGSVANILSVGLRMFALTTLDTTRHRRFLVLDEQDCWLRPDLVPKLVKIVHDAGRALGFQVLMISHHDASSFQQYADRLYALVPQGEEGVEIRRLGEQPADSDTDV